MTKLWGGRFKEKEMLPSVLEFTSSLSVDKVLAKYDCIASKAHVEMLERSGLLSKDEKKAITAALDEFMSRVEKGDMDFGLHEDIHSAVQSYVEEKAGDAAKKMHTGRSRNEQVVNDVRLYCKDAIVRMERLIKKLQGSFVELAEKNMDALVPGYTHLNHAQPILLSHLLLAYVEMFERDRMRLVCAKDRCDVSVMGSGAIAGSSLDLGREFLAEKLGFAGVSANSIDSVSDRDFMAELLAALSITSVHLSRISEDLILYSTEEFGFLSMGDEYCTGSSLMPQKKNADVLELIRGKCGSVIGALSSLLVVMKGLPHAYNRDMQEDKKPLFESVETVAASLGIMAELVKTIVFDKVAMKAKLGDESIFATDIAEYLVRKGVAFKDAHSITGKIVRHCADEKKKISKLALSKLKEFAGEFEKDVFDLLSAENSVKMKKTYGSTNPEFVKKEVLSWKRKLERNV